MREFFIRNREILFPVFLAVFLLQFWGLSPYYDDIHRFSSDTTNLANQGRPLTEWLYFSYNAFQSNLFPNLYNFNLVTIWFISVISFFIVTRFSGKDNGDLVAILFICIFSVPGIVQSLAFHVDNVGMIASIMLSIMAGSFVKELNARSISIQIAALCCATLFYQLSFNYYISACAIFIMIKCCDEDVEVRQLLKMCAIKAIPLAVSILVALSYKHYFAHDSYFLEHSSFMSVNDIKDGRLNRNINVMEWSLSLTYNKLQWIIFKTLTVAAIASWLTLQYKFFLKKNYSGSITLLASPITVLLMVLLPSLLIYHPVIEQRTLTTISMVLACLMSLCIKVKYIKKISIFALLLLSITNTMLAAAFVSTQEYSTERTSALLRDVYYHLPDGVGLKDGSIRISIPMSKTPRASGEMLNNFSYFPPLRMMVMDYFYSEYQTNALLRYKNIGMEVAYTKEICSSKPIVSKMMYVINECNGITYVQFK